MKTITLLQSATVILFTGLILIGCSPNNPGSNPALQTTFKFTANGTTLQWDGDLSSTSATGSIIKRTSPYNELEIIAQTTVPSVLNPGTTEVHELHIPLLSTTAALTPGTYNSHIVIPPNIATGAIYFDGCSFDHSGDDINTVITSVSNGYASGTFSGYIICYGSTPLSGCAQRTTFTNGEFHNVKIIN